MRSIRFCQGSLIWDETPRPTKPGPDDIIVQIIYSSICGTDLHIIKKDLPIKDGIILGHEMVGIADAIGEHVTDIKVGDKVAVDPGYFCGSCRSCLRGDNINCEPGGLKDFIGSQKDGGWTEYIQLPKRQVLKIPESMSLKQACLIEPFSSVMKAYMNNPMMPDSRVLVQGAGMIGLLFCSLFKHFGFRNVTLTEVMEGRRKIALTCGLGFKVCEPEEVSKELKDPAVAEKSGFDLIVDTTGNNKALEEGITWLRMAGKYILFGLVPENDTARINPLKLTLKQNSIVTSVFVETYFEPAINILDDMYKSGFDIEKLGVQVFPLENYKDALHAMSEFKITKAVLQPSKID